MDWKKLTRPDRLVIAVAILFVIDLLALPWIDVSIGPFSATSAGTGSPDGFLGILALLVGLGIVLSVALERFTSVQLPSVPAKIGGKPVGAAGMRYLAALLAFALIALKFVLHPHPSYLGAGCWAGLVLGAALVGASHRSRHDTAAAAPGD